MSNALTASRPLVITLFSADEIACFRRLARAPSTFEKAAGAVQRLQVLRTFHAGALDWEAAVGAEYAEANALSELARIPAPNRDGFRLKEALLASAEPSADHNLVAMLQASVTADAVRLGMCSRAPAYSGSQFVQEAAQTTSVNDAGEANSSKERSGKHAGTVRRAATGMRAAKSVQSRQ